MFSIRNNQVIIIADHLRTIIFILKDGVVFGPKGREYILRKLLKKICLLFYLNNLELEIIKKISEKIIDINSLYYTELSNKREEIIKEISRELQKQFDYFVQVNKRLESILKDKITVEKLFFLYDTQGVPLEMIERFLKTQKKNFPKKRFAELLKKQKEKSQQERRNKKISIF